MSEKTKTKGEAVIEELAKLREEQTKTAERIAALESRVPAQSGGDPGPLDWFDEPETDPAGDE